MQSIENVTQLRAQISQWRKQGEKIAFVPTMGNLHQGHLNLVQEAKKLADRVVVSIFVNPTQFGVGEDFDSYPRTLEQDREKLAEVATDVLFTPSVSQLYPQGIDASQWVSVSVPGLSDLLCGASRPGHFTGVATIVTKLFNLVQPDLAVFGEKDYQQLMVIRRFTQELCFPIEIVGVPTARAQDGLALSSRNGYLTPEQREIAPKLYQTLQALALRASSSSAPLSEQLSQQFTQQLLQLQQQAVGELTEAGFRVDYLEVRDATTLATPGPDSSELVVLVAAFLGKPRLIDNLVFSCV